MQLPFGFAGFDIHVALHDCYIVCCYTFLLWQANRLTNFDAMPDTGTASDAPAGAAREARLLSELEPNAIMTIVILIVGLAEWQTASVPAKW